MQVVDGGIERMASGKLCNIGVIEVGVQADHKTERLIGAGGNFQALSVTVLVVIKPRDRIGKFQPRAVVALQRKIAGQPAHASDGKSFARRSLVTERGGLQIFAGNFWRDVNLQRHGEAFDCSEC